MAAANTPSSSVNPQTVERAVKALLKWRANKSETEKPQLLESDEFLYLILTLKKIPQKGTFNRTNAHKISLSTPLIDPQNENSELCLIIDDRPKSGMTKEIAKKKIDNDNIPISKIIKLSKLKSDYKPFEAKRKLCDSYDMFLADKRVLPLLPKMLGKQFFKKKKIPVGVDLKHKNWKEQIEKICSSGLLYLRNGTCSVVKVGRMSMSGDVLVKNVVDAINGIAEIVPRKWGGIRSFHLKLLESLALPVYEALPDFKLKIEGFKGAEENVGAVVKKDVSKEKKVGKKKGRLHEVRYMDDAVNEESSDHDFVDEEVLTGVDAAEFDSDFDDDSDGSEELVGNKRKKGVKGSIEKKVKKSKVKEDGSKLKKKVKSVKFADDVKIKKKEGKRKIEDGVKLKKLKKTKNVDGAKVEKSKRVA